MEEVEIDRAQYWEDTILNFIMKKSAFEHIDFSNEEERHDVINGLENCIAFFWNIEFVNPNEDE